MFLNAAAVHSAPRSTRITSSGMEMRRMATPVQVSGLQGENIFHQTLCTSCVCVYTCLTIGMRLFPGHSLCVYVYVAVCMLGTVYTLANNYGD
jgi:hypothetical protein